MEHDGVQHVKHVCVEPAWFYKMIPHNSIDSVHVHFPKTKSDKLVETPFASKPLKRSFVSPRFLMNIHKNLKSDGEIHVLTDNLEICLSALHAFQACGNHFVSLIPAPFFMNEVHPAYAAGLPSDLLALNEEKKREGKSVFVKMPSFESNEDVVNIASSPSGEKFVVTAPKAPLDESTEEGVRSGLPMEHQTTTGAAVTSGPVSDGQESDYLKTRVKGIQSIPTAQLHGLKGSTMSMEDNMHLQKRGAQVESLTELLTQQDRFLEMIRNDETRQEGIKGMNRLLGGGISMKEQIDLLVQSQIKQIETTQQHVSVFDSISTKPKIPNKKSPASENAEVYKSISDKNQLYYLRFVKSESVGVNWRLDVDQVNSRHLAMPPA
eukprot:GDKJ01016841.1.p1 GENE.GDKJ01016841.1~~GDKJ01016841.1.p1  ORF type:complete len:379 (+),score=67.12 GDKJ01016841.1:414-1550(+)